MKCNCGHPDCKREVNVTWYGKIIVTNHWTCPRVWVQVTRVKNLRFGTKGE